MLDLAITGGTVVTPDGANRLDVGVRGELIVAVACPHSLPPAIKTIDASDKIVVPGGVEAHTHIGFRHIVRPSGVVTAGPEAISQAAIWGGTTTYFDFANAAVNEQSNVLANIEAHLEHFKGKSYADYSVHTIYRGPGTSRRTLDQIGDVISAGFPSVKTYTTDHAPRPGQVHNMTSPGQMHQIMTETAKHGGIVAIHSEDDRIVQHNYESYRAQQKWDWWYLPEIRSNLSEDLSARTNVRLAELTGAAAYFVHVSAREAVDVVARTRADGHPFYAETILLYGSFTSDDYRKPDGMKYHTYPGTKSALDRERLWDGLINGDISILATDAIATTYADKIRGRTVVDVEGGNIGVEIRMGIAFSDGVVARGMSLERYAHVTSAGPAKILGLYPRKGAIAVGSDADLVIIDPTVSKRLSLSDLHLGDYSPWEGWSVRGWPTVVTLRGKVIVEGGSFYGNPTDGKHIDGRKLGRDVLMGPGA